MVRTCLLLLAAVSIVCLAPPSAADPPARVEFKNSGRVLGADLPFSEAVRLGDTLYLSGQVGIAPGTLKLVPGGVRAEAQQALENIRAILEANGRTTADLVKCTVMLADMGDWPAFNEVYRAFLKKPLPARSAFGTNGLALGARVEIECLASAGP
ncbi:MAG: RidA family protein [Proteobacteria bacterium]|nr:RidA family protein [Pseudomonadota bacterium]